MNLVAEEISPNRPSQLVAERWSLDGQSVFFSKEPYGVGGYILFPGASSLYKVNVNDHQVSELIPFNVETGRMLCLDALSVDERYVADHCGDKVITIRDLTTGQTTTIQPPTNAPAFELMGASQFSPDGSRVAFAFAMGDPNGPQGWIAVSDSLSGSSRLIVSGQPGQYFTVVAWLNANTLLLQSNPMQCGSTCVNELFAADVNSGNLLKVADGMFLTLISEGQ